MLLGLSLGKCIYSFIMTNILFRLLSVCPGNLCVGILNLFKCINTT